MLPLVPFDILIPLTILATLLCLGLIAWIVTRRTLLEWWSRGGHRVTDEAEAILRTALAAPDRSQLMVSDWLGRGGSARIDGLVRAIERMRQHDPTTASSVVEQCAIPLQLARIIAPGPQARLARRTDRWKRVAATRAAATLRLTDVTHALDAAIDDPDVEVAYAAAAAVSRLDRPAGAEAIMNRIGSHPKLNNARLAAFVEGMTCDLEAVFRAQLDRTDVQALFWTATLIGRKKVFELGIDIRPLLDSGDANVRAAACECVGELGVPLTDRWLAARLYDEQWFVQSHAAKAIGQFRSAWAISDLVEMLASREWWVRQNAIDALVRIGPACIPDVQALLASPDRFARNCAVEVLDRVGWVETMLKGAARRQKKPILLLTTFGRSGGLGYLENALFSAPEAAVPALLEILRELGDDATFGRLRAAAERLPEHLRAGAYAVAAEVRGR